MTSLSCAVAPAASSLPYASSVASLGRPSPCHPCRRIGWPSSWRNSGLGKFANCMAILNPMPLLSISTDGRMWRPGGRWSAGCSIWWIASQERCQIPRQPEMNSSMSYRPMLRSGRLGRVQCSRLARRLCTLHWIATSSRWQTRRSTISQSPV